MNASPSAGRFAFERLTGRQPCRVATFSQRSAAKTLWRGVAETKRDDFALLRHGLKRYSDQGDQRVASAA